MTKNWKLATVVMLLLWIGFFGPEIADGFAFCHSALQGVMVKPPKYEPQFHPLTCPPYPCMPVSAVGWMVRR